MHTSDVDQDGNGPPPSKKFSYESVLIANMSSQGIKCENLKLKAQLERSIKSEKALQDRIEQLEKRKTKDDELLNVINRYWNQLDKDVRILLHRFNSETSDETENQVENQETTSFLTQLVTWNKVELEQKLASRVTVSTRAVAKLIQAFDHLQQHSLNLTAALEGESGVTNSEDVRERNRELEEDNDSLQSLNARLNSAHRVPSLITKQLEEQVGSKETGATKFCSQLRIPDPDEKLEELRKPLDEVKKVVQNRLTELQYLRENHRATLEEAESRKSHLRITEQLESQEILAQNMLKSELIQREDLLGQVRREYDMLRIEYEKNLAANEQLSPICTEMRTLLTTLHIYNQQLKAEITSLKGKQQTLLRELAQAKREKKELKEEGLKTPAIEQYYNPASPTNDECPNRQQNNKLPKGEKLGIDETSSVRALLEQRINELEKEQSAQRAEQEALISEMEVTGEAFEDLQDQNLRLLQKLTEKSDANFKLTSDKIKSNQIIKLLRQEGELLKEQMEILTMKVEAQNQVIRKLEEMEKVLIHWFMSQDKY